MAEGVSGAGPSRPSAPSAQISTEAGPLHRSSQPGPLHGACLTRDTWETSRRYADHPALRRRCRDGEAGVAVFVVVGDLAAEPIRSPELSGALPLVELDLRERKPLEAVLEDVDGWSRCRA